jgi:hypothetical protein
VSHDAVYIALGDTLPPPADAEAPCPVSVRSVRGTALGCLAEALFGPDAAPIHAMTPVAPDLSWLDEPQDNTATAAE